MSASYNMMEMMICAAARQLEDGKTVAVGTGAPCAAAMLAQKTHAPNLVIVFEAGGLAPRLPGCPSSWAIRAPSTWPIAPRAWPK
jgi:glutaconate CoA-transferase subunit B